MRLVDIEPFEKASCSLKLSYNGTDGLFHTIVIPIADIPTYGSRAPMPDYISGALGSEKNGKKEEHISPVNITSSLHDYDRMSIDELDLKVRSYNCLKRANIDTIGELITKSDTELGKIRNLGSVSVNEIIYKLSELGLCLAEEK